MKLSVFVVSFFLFCTSVQFTFAQGKRNVLQFTGIVVSSESESSIPGVHIYAPKGGRGTTSDASGFFSMPVLSGDSLIISAIGFEKEHLIIPEDQKEGLTVVMRLESDTTYLEELEVYPFPSEELFKEAILAFQLPSRYDHMNQNVDQEMLNKIYQASSLGPSGNNFYYNQQKAATYNRRFQANTISLLNPFAWNQFIKSLKKRNREK